MINDGAGWGTWDAAAYWQYGSREGAPYADFPQRLAVTTFPLNSSSQPTGDNAQTLGYDAGKAWDTGPVPACRKRSTSSDGARGASVTICQLSGKFDFLRHRQLELFRLAGDSTTNDAETFMGVGDFTGQLPVWDINEVDSVLDLENAMKAKNSTLDLFAPDKDSR